MTTRSDPKIRLTIVIAIAISIGVLIVLLSLPAGEKVVHVQQDKKADSVDETRSVEKTQSVEKLGKRKVIKAQLAKSVKKVPIHDDYGPDWDPGDDHPFIQPSDFYSQSNIEEPLANKPASELARSRSDRKSALAYFLLSDADLLGDQWFSSVSDFATRDQLLQARQIARTYDERLKDLRRERAEILEQAGVTIKDPSDALKQNRVRLLQMVTEANWEFSQKILNAEQRRLAAEKYRLWQIGKIARQKKLEAEQKAAEVR